MKELDLYSYLVGGAVAMSYMLVPRFEKIVDKLVKKIKNRLYRKDVI